MRKVERIEQQIRELSVPEFAEPRDWVIARDWKAWGVEIEADARSGKLDKLIAETEADYAAGGSMPAEVLATADKSHALLKENPSYPSLRFKKIGPLWSARVGERYRA